MAVDRSSASSPADTAPAPRAGFLSQAQLAVRQGMKRRFLWATLLAVVCLGILIFLGPDQQSIKDKFEYYGTPGELRIMPEISIDQGRDRTHQLPRSLQQPPPPTVVEVPDENAAEDGFEPVPRPREAESDQPLTDRSQYDPNAEVSDREQVELSLPQQSNPDWFILNMVRPEYPLQATLQERKTPVIFVKAAVFLDVEGQVSASMVTATNGSQVFTDAVLAAVDQWRFAWRITPTAGRWIEMTWNFRSPFFTRDFLDQGS